MSTKYEHLNKPIRIGSLYIKNRMFTAPTGIHALTNGETWFTDAIIEHFANRAKGGAGLVTCTGVQINPNTVSDRNHLHINPYSVEGKRSIMRLAERIHYYGAKASMELGDQFVYKPFPAVVAGLSKFGQTSVEMTREQMEKRAEMYGEAAALVKACGFDMVMLHIGHHGDVGKFLSPIANTRTDEFGGNLENRIRYPMMILKSIREKVGPKFPIDLRFSVSEVAENGITVEDSVYFVKQLDGLVDMLNCSCGMNDKRYFTTTHPSGFLPDTPNAQYAAALKAAGITIPCVAIGAIQDLDQAEEILASGKADAVMMARGIIADPFTPKKALKGQPEEVVPCIKCYKCHDSSNYYNHFCCSVNPTMGMEDMLPEIASTPTQSHKVMVIGGGPAGMFAAFQAAQRGHTVTLYEKEDHLGGQLNFADYAWFKRDLKRYKEYLIRKVYDSGITVNLSTEVTPGLISAEAPDSVITAVGAKPLMLQLPGIDCTIPAISVFGSESSLGERIVIIGGGQVGVETAIHLSDCRKDVTILEMRDEVAPDAWYTYRLALNIELERNNIHIVTGGTCSSISGGGVSYIDRNGTEHTLPADNVILAAGMLPDSDTVLQLETSGVPMTLIGDCEKVGTVEQATRTAFAAAMNL